MQYRVHFWVKFKKEFEFRKGIGFDYITSVEADSMIEAEDIAIHKLSTLERNCIECATLRKIRLLTPEITRFSDSDENERLHGDGDGL